METVRKTTLQDLWSIAEESAAEHGNTVRREDWGIVSGVHLAETKEQAFEDIRKGGARVVTEYFAQTLGNPAPDVPPDQIVDYMVENNQWIVGTPDDCIEGNKPVAGNEWGLWQLYDPGRGLGPERKRSCIATSCWPVTSCPISKAAWLASRTPSVGLSNIKGDLQAFRKASIQRATDVYDASRQA